MRSRRRRIGQDSGGTASGNQVLSLSLFIMLLAFFIVINAISNFEDTKVKPVLQSLEYAFASKLTLPLDQRPSMTQSDEPALGEGDTLDRMKALFKAQIPGHEAKVNKRQGTMHLEMPLAEFEAAIMALGTPGKAGGMKGEFFLNALVALLKNEKAGQPYRMDILINVKGNPARLQNEKPHAVQQAGKRLSELAKKIEKTGLKKRYLSIGIKEGKPETVELFFLPHVPFNPLENKAYEKTGQP